MFSGRHELPKTEDGTYFIDRYLLSIRTIQHLTHSFTHSFTHSLTYRII